MKRLVYSILGVLVVAWLVLYLSTYGVLVYSDTGKLKLKPDNTVDFYVSSTELGGPPAAELETRDMIDRLRCVYFIASGTMTIYIDPQRQLCPRLRDFSEWRAPPKTGS